jgi:uncharacterized protein (DUF849 family)
LRKIIAQSGAAVAELDVRRRTRRPNADALVAADVLDRAFS